MKFNHDQNKQSFAFAALFSLCAIAGSITSTAIKPLSESEAKLENIEQQIQAEEKPKQFESGDRGNDEVWSEVEVDKEWEGILKDESGEENIIALRPGV